MADRQHHQPSSSSSSHPPTHQSHSYNNHSQRMPQNAGRPHDNRPQQFGPASQKRFNTDSRPITNSENTHGVKSMAFFCQHNPQHVISERNRKDHERYDCPDRLWIPGETRVKYNDLEI